MPLTQVTVGAPSLGSLADGATPGVLGGRQAEQIVSHLHGKYYAQNVRGNLYYATTAAPGIGFTIFSATTAPTLVALCVWNPQNSTKNISMVRASVGLAAVATVNSGFGYAWVGNAGSSLATLAVASVFTALTTRGSCVCGPAGQGSSVALCSVAPTLTTALVWGRAASFGISAGTSITVQTAPPMLSEDFEGTMIVPPGTIWALTTNILTNATATASLIWEEIPI